MTVALQDAQRQGFDVLSVTVGPDQKLDTAREHRDTLEHTALGSTFTGGFDSLYRTGHEDIEFFVDLRAAYESGEQTSLLLPLMTGGECLGAIHIGSDRPDLEALVEYRPLLKRMAQLVASAIQNARLFDQAVNLQALNQSVVMSIQQGIVVLDSARRIISINDSMRQRYGWDNSALRQELFTYRPDYADFLTDDLQRLFETATPQERIGQRLIDGEGNPLITNFYIYPLRSEEAVRGAVLLVEDVTERSQLEEAIEARANQLAALTEVSTRITSSLEREEVIQVALTEMGKIIPYDAMLLWRRTGAFMGLEGAAGVADATLATQGIRVNFDLIDRMRQVVEAQRVICVHDPDGLKEQLPGEEGVQSWMGVPLVSQSNVVGMVVLVKYEPGTTRRSPSSRSPSLSPARSPSRSPTPTSSSRPSSAPTSLGRCWKPLRLLRRPATWTRCSAL
jgi:PAS domain S-box-containing protein